MEFYCGNKQRVKRVVCFRTEALSLTFDRILNVTLPEKFSTTGVTQGNLELPQLPYPLDSHQKQKQMR